MQRKSDDLKSYIRSLEVPEAPPSDVLSADDVLEAGKTEATVVGSEVISFTDEVALDVRQAIIDSALLAQLVAKKRVLDDSLIYEWFDEYFDVLRNLGWVVQDSGFTEYVATSDDFEAHKAVIDLATDLLGLANPALILVKKALTTLRDAQDDEPFFTIWTRETRKAHSGRFQVSLVDSDATGHFVTLLAFGMHASSQLTQVLLVKVRRNDVRIKNKSAKVSINSELLKSNHPEIREKILAHQRSYIIDLDI